MGVLALRKKNREWRARYVKEFERCWKRLGKYVALEAYAEASKPLFRDDPSPSAKEAAEDCVDAIQVKLP